MGFLIFVGIVVLILILISKDSKSRQSSSAIPPGDWRQQYDAGWARFIASYRKDSKLKAEKLLIDKMLSDLRTQGYAVPQDVYSDEIAPQVYGYPEVERPADVMPQANTMPAVVSMPQQHSSTKLDNASLLLYFGAFLFVASVGLFVAFGGFPGGVRTFAVALVAATLYGGGVWIFRNRVALNQAGLAFAGIGIAIAPFVGLAAYGFVFNKSSGALIWFVTSLVCMGMYLHALFTLRKPLLNYILIFTFLSLVLSGVSVVDAPIYYFGWGLGAVGILLSVLGRHKGFDKALQDASSNSAKVFLPLAVLASLIMIDNQGTGQLGISLLLAAVYYAVEFRFGEATARVENAVASQVAAIFALGAVTYSLWSEFWLVSLVVVGFNAIQLLYLYLRSRPTGIWTNFGSILLASGIMAALLSIQKPAVLLISLVALVTVCGVVWLRQTRSDAYGLGVVAWMVLPLAVGQLYLEPNLTTAGQTYLSLAALLAQYAVVFNGRSEKQTSWRIVAKVFYILSSTSVLLIAAMALPAVCMASALVIAASMVLLAERHRDASWSAVAGFAAIVPVLRTIPTEGWFAASTTIALVANIAVAIRYRHEVTRWLGSGLWLLLPVALGNGPLGQWSAAQFGWAYMIVLAGFVFARAVATGSLFVSEKVPLSSYARTASMSYVTGYCLAGTIALIITLFSEHSQLHTSLVLAILGLVVWLLADKIERHASLYVLLPLVAQALLLSTMRPDVSSQSFDIYLLGSSTLAAIVYLVFLNPSESQNDGRAAAMRQGSLITAAITPIAFIFVGETHLMMPVGLLVFTALLYHRLRSKGQQSKEWVGALGLVGIWWIMWFAGVHSAQAYTHVLAALFAAYAYWRHRRSENMVSDKYLVAMLATATVPLILQALGGVAGSVYGWWLLLEQVFFMLLGMSLGKPFVTRWGLYVAVGAVIYQLRGLGWAALTVLAVFLIGLAVYRLQKQDKK